MIEISGGVLPSLLLNMVSSITSKSGAARSTGNATAGSSRTVSGVTGEDGVAFSGGAFTVSRLLFEQHLERHWVQSAPVRRQEHLVVMHFDERLQVQQPSKGSLCRFFLAGGKLFRVNEDRSTLGQMSLNSADVDEDTARL